MAYSKKEKFSEQEVTLAEIAKALNHPARIAILKLLASRNTCVCGEIVDELPLSQSTVSQHLKALKDARLIQGEIDGPKVCYCLNPAGIRRFSRFMTQLGVQLEEAVRKKSKCC